MVTREEAVESLARKLHWKMEHLEPTEDPEWDGLSDRQKEFYTTLVEWLALSVAEWSALVDADPDPRGS